MALKSPYKKTRDVAVIAGKRPHQLVCLSQYLRSAVAEDKPSLRAAACGATISTWCAFYPVVPEKTVNSSFAKSGRATGQIACALT